MTQPIYLDYAATTPTDPRVAHRMGACLTVHGNFGNPASRSHSLGWQAEEAVEAARAQIAKLLHADVREIIWTSGATESDNLALKGPALVSGQTRRHIVTTAIEHKAVLDTCAYLETQGFEVTYLMPDVHGCIEPSAVARALRDDTLIASVMHVNNELIKRAEFVEEEKVERISFSVRFFDENDQRVLACFFTKMYDENKNLMSERRKLYDDLREKYGQKIDIEL